MDQSLRSDLCNGGANGGVRNLGYVTDTFETLNCGVARMAIKSGGIVVEPRVEDNAWARIEGGVSDGDPRPTKYPEGSRGTMRGAEQAGARTPIDLIVVAARRSEPYVGMVRVALIGTKDQHDPAAEERLFAGSVRAATGQIFPDE